MRIGIVVQTIMQTGAVLTAFLVGLYFVMQSQVQLASALSFLLRYDWVGTKVDVQQAGPVKLLTLSLCELFHAYTSALGEDVGLQAGCFWQQVHAVRCGPLYCPNAAGGHSAFLQPIFNTTCQPQPSGWLCWFWRYSPGHC